MAATEIAKAYVQIVPSAKGIKGGIETALGGEAESAGKNAGSSFGSNLIGMATKIIAAAGIGKAISTAVSAGADLEQSIGGIETLFGTGGKTIEQFAASAGKSVAEVAGQYGMLQQAQDLALSNAANAYKTAGVSANDYMQTITSFAAALKSSGLNELEAAKAADQAVIDMADNANKMGTSMDSIQMAYQGFAKQNYTMLDNLKLGYGGTKTEMERLLSDAEKISGVKYDINNLSDVYSAIHVIQDELGITGTTATEAASTISGSAAAMGAAFKNVLGNLALGNDIRPALEGLLEATTTFLFGNLLPAIGNVFAGLPDIFMGIVAYVPNLIEAIQQFIEPVMTTIQETDWLGMIGEVVNSIISTVTENAPNMIQGGIELVTNLWNGILENWPTIITGLGDIFNQILTAVLELAPQLMTGGFQLMVNLATGIITNLPAILSAILQVVMQIISTLISGLPGVLSTGIQLMGSLASGILGAIGQVIAAAGNVVSQALSRLASAAGQMLSKGREWITNVASGITGAVGSVLSAAAGIISGAVNAFTSYDWGSLGSRIVSGIVSGVSGAAGSLFSSLQNLASNALSAAKNALGIKSPSRVFAKEVGQWIPKGIAQGIDGEDAPVVAINRQVDAMLSAGRSAVDADYGSSTYNYGGFAINIYASPSQTASDIADEVSKRINEATLRKAAAWA